MARIEQDELCLPRFYELEVDFRQELGVQQGAVLGAAAGVDAIAGAEIIQAIGTGGMLAPRQDECIDEALASDRNLSRAFELGIQKAEIESGVVGNESAVADELQQFLSDLREPRFVVEEIGGQAVHRKGLGRHVSFRVDIAVEVFPARHFIDELDTAYLDQPVSLDRIKSRGFSVEHDFAHKPAPRRLTFAAAAF
jgi:hypothetical protein